MDNFRRPGGMVLLTAPSGGVVSGGLYKIGSLIVVAAADVTEEATFEGAPKGVFALPKVKQEAWTEGLKLYFDEAAGLITSDDGSAANPLVGVAAAAQLGAVTIETDVDGSDQDIVDNVLSVVDYTGFTGKTITLTLTSDGVLKQVVLTEGVDFDAETSHAQTATNIAAAIDALADFAAEATMADVEVTAVAVIKGAVRLDGVVR